jgi:hypothetical protein
MTADGGDACISESAAEAGAGDARVAGAVEADARDVPARVFFKPDDAIFACCLGSSEVLAVGRVPGAVTGEAASSLDHESLMLLTTRHKRRYPGDSKGTAARSRAGE